MKYYKIPKLFYSSMSSYQTLSHITMNKKYSSNMDEHSNEIINGAFLSHESFNKNVYKGSVLIDPRGFRTSLTYNQLCRLIQHSTINNGYILNDCIYALYGKTLSLYSVDDPDIQPLLSLYKQEQKTDYKDGDIITHENGKNYKYFGIFYALYSTTYNWINGNYRQGLNLTIHNKKYHVYQDEETGDFVHSGNKLPCISSKSLNQTVDDVIQLYHKEKVDKDINAFSSYDTYGRILEFTKYKSFQVKLIPDTNMNSIDKLLETYNSYVLKNRTGDDIMVLGNRSLNHSLSRKSLLKLEWNHMTSGLFASHTSEHINRLDLSTARQVAIEFPTYRILL